MYFFTKYLFTYLLTLEEAKEILKKNREAKGLTQTDMANRLGLGLRMYQKIEDGNFPKYKKEHIANIDEILGTNLYALIYEFNVPHESTLNDNNEDYLITRRKLKQGKNDNDGIVYVPISAQAGYSKRYKEPIYLNTLETAYLPGTRYRGEKYRIFEVDGDSMTPTLKDGQKVIAALVDKDDWQSCPNYYMYVLVSEDMMSIKRIFRKSSEQWVLISDNEDFYEQFGFEVKHLKELWIVKEKLDWDLAPPKKFEIKI